MGFNGLKSQGTVLSSLVWNPQLNVRNPWSDWCCLVLVWSAINQTYQGIRQTVRWPKYVQRPGGEYGHLINHSSFNSFQVFYLNFFFCFWFAKFVDKSHIIIIYTSRKKKKELYDNVCYYVQVSVFACILLKSEQACCLNVQQTNSEGTCRGKPCSLRNRIIPN